jgi:hypothetical protein
MARTFWVVSAERLSRDKESWSNIIGEFILPYKGTTVKVTKTAYKYASYLS